MKYHGTNLASKGALGGTSQSDWEAVELGGMSAAGCLTYIQLRHDRRKKTEAHQN
jgi:hypothetical protein